MQSVTTSNYHELVDDAKTALFFIGDNEPETGKSWCDDCQAAAEAVSQAIPLLESKGYKVLYCLVGDKETWKSPTNPARLNTWIAVNSIPTLLLVENRIEQHRLEEEALYTLDALNKILN